MDPINPIKVLILIGELEGCYAHTKKLGFEEDNKILDEMKQRYYKLYFKTAKEEKANNPIDRASERARLLIGDW